MGRPRRVIAVVVGVALGALLFAGIGSHSGHEVADSVIGAAVGGFVAVGACRGWLSIPVTGGIFSSILAAFLGPACDDYGGISILPAFFFGMGLTYVLHAVIRHLGVRVFLLLPAVGTGIVAVATAEPAWLIACMILGILTLNALVKEDANFRSRRTSADDARQPPHEDDR